MSQRFARPHVLVIAAGLALMLTSPLAGQADEASQVFTQADPARMEHIMGSGGLGSRFEDTVMMCAPLDFPTGQHLMGSGGLGSEIEDTLVPADSGTC